MRIGFIGLGNMGSAMAANLVKAGHEVTVYNRSRPKVDALAAQGARPADSVADACGGDLVLTMLANDDAVAEVTFGDGGIVASLADGAAHVSSSTISVALSERMTAAHDEAGQRFVAAPVFGRPEAAQAGKLFVVAAGQPATIQAVSQAFDDIAQRTFVVSEEPKTANLVKLSGNFLITSVIESVGDGAGQQGGRGQARVSGAPHLDAVRRPHLCDLRRVDRKRTLRTSGIRSISRAEGHSARAHRRRGVAGADARRQLDPRPVPDAARPRRRGPRLVGGRRTGRVGGGR
jgi:NAD binding domain of 6-phosphogluconate dehydrogenase